MSEYKTLDKWFPDGKPDGRSFTISIDDYFFTPFFRDVRGYWHGLTNKNESTCWPGKSSFYEFIPPKKTKKVTMYKPVAKGYEDSVYSPRCEWHTDKNNWKGQINGLPIIGWLTQEVEVEE